MEQDLPTIQEAAESFDLTETIKFLQDAYIQSTPGVWKKGRTTHQTVTDNNYKIGEFHHASDAHFVDACHGFMPRIIAELNKLNELKSKT